MRLRMPAPRRQAQVLLAAALVAGLTLPVSAPAATPSFVVRYRSAANVYLDGGRAQGLNVGDRLAFVVAGATVAELEIIFLAEGSASCRVVVEKRSVRAGDTFTLLPRAEAPKPAAETGDTSVPPAVVAAPPGPATSLPGGKPAAPWARLRGYLSAGLYKVWDAGDGFNFDQRIGRADVSLYEIGGQPLALSARFRSRRDQRSLSLGSTRLDKRNDLYELSLRYEPPSDNVAFEVGRLGTSRFTSVGYLDGGLFRVRLGSPLQIGGFFGRRANIDGLGAEAAGQRYGAFFRVSPRTPYSASYDVVLAVVREFSRSDLSREYVGLESRFGQGKFTLFQRAEVDVNRGWRRDLSDKPYQMSNVSVATNMRFSPSVTAVLSYDGLRNYRDYFTRDVPEQVFDDLLRQGFRSNLYLGRGYGLSATLGFGLRLPEQNKARPGPSSNSYSYNGGLRHGNLFSKDISLNADVNAFQNATSVGYLTTVVGGKRFRRGYQFDLGYGRSLYKVRETGLERRTEYVRFTGRGDLGRHVYLMADVEYDRGDDLRGPRGFFEIGYQF